MNIGEYDDRNPAGAGYILMTHTGRKVFDQDERDEFLKARARTLRLLEKPRKPKKLHDPTDQCRKCLYLYRPKCLPPAVGKCDQFLKHQKSLNNFH